MKYRPRIFLCGIVLVMGWGAVGCREQQIAASIQPEPTMVVPAEKGVSGILAVPGAGRVDLYWNEPAAWCQRPEMGFEVEADTGTGFAKAHEKPLDVCAFSHFVSPGQEVHYRVRAVVQSATGGVSAVSAWSKPVAATALRLEDSDLPAEVQQACFRYFWNYGHPVSGLAREGAGNWGRNTCSVAATGMLFFNLAVGIEQGWITRTEGLERIQKVLTFLLKQADRFHGVFPHWLDGSNGRVVPFSDQDDGADLVETALLISGALFFREYVKGDSTPAAAAIREMVDQLWRGVEWDWFVKDCPDGRRPLRWHWSPNHGFAIDLEITGFNECQIVYLLALASPTHPITADSYFKGWLQPGYSHARTVYGLPLELGREPYGPPAFLTHYSYLGVNPAVLRCGSKTYFDEFRDFARVQMRWAADCRPELDRGIWGLTACLGPDGYGVHFPGQDDGTIAPTASLASMPYAPEEVRTCLEKLYRGYARQLWGPYGFYDAMNVSRNWYSREYIAIDVGPIAPMIENHRTSLGWNTLMNAPELRQSLAIINQAGS